MASGVPGGEFVAGRDGVPGEDLGLSIAAELNVRGGTRGVPSEQPRGDKRGAVAAEPHYGAASYDPVDDDDFETGAQAVGT